MPRKLATLTLPELLDDRPAERVGGGKLIRRSSPRASTRSPRTSRNRSPRSRARGGLIKASADDTTFELIHPRPPPDLPGALGRRGARFHEIHGRALAQAHGADPEHAFEIASHLDAAGSTGKPPSYLGGRGHRG
ncbi:MAG: hypothetical protein U0166_04245 [Acidobacteriota bacterium]